MIPVVLKSASGQCGKFGMSLEEAKNKFLASIQKLELPYVMKEGTASSGSTCFYFHLGPFKKEEEPLENIRKLAEEYGAWDDEKTWDSPLEYWMMYEIHVTVPAGEYVASNV